MHATTKDLWTLALAPGDVDPTDLVEAIEAQLASGDLDYRTRLLIRDAMAALSQSLPALAQSLRQQSPHRLRLEQISGEHFGPPGFPNLARRIMPTTKPEDVLRFLRELGNLVRQRQRIFIGGSVALILDANLTRRTEDIDVVDEVPAELRNQPELLRELSRRYSLTIAHFQSHFLPTDWQKRTRSLGLFGQLEAHLIDVYDVVLSKLFSAREKDRDDLRIVIDQLDKPKLTQRLLQTCHPLLAEPALRRNAQQNWYILFGESLPTAPPPSP